MKIATIIDSESGKRADRPEYPIKAVREAVLNAVIHRDYSVYTEGTPIQVNMFRDRIEIHSPGNLYGRMTVEQLGTARPDLRNPTLAVMTESLTGAENRYSGIPTIRREMRANGLREPVFEERRNEFVVTLYNEKARGFSYVGKTDFKADFVRETSNYNAGTYRTADYHTGVYHTGIHDAGGEEAEQQILRFCREPRLRSEIAEMLGIKTTFYVMERYVDPLVKTHKLAMTLPEKPKSKFQRYYTV